MGSVNCDGEPAQKQAAPSVCYEPSKVESGALLLRSAFFRMSLFLLWMGFSLRSGCSLRTGIGLSMWRVLGTGCCFTRRRLRMRCILRTRSGL